MQRVILVISVIVLCSILDSANGKAHLTPVRGPRIVNGQNASDGQFPWEAALYFRAANRPGYEFFCGGALISPEWILTAAHCVHEMDSVRILFGSVYLKETDPNRLQLTSKRLYLHDGFVLSTLTHDIGLVRLEQPIQLQDNKFIQIIPMSESHLEDDEDVTVSGWGATSDDNRNLSTILKYAQLRTISNDLCRKIFGSIVTRNFVCTVSSDMEVRTTCAGDSGSPLVDNMSVDPVHVGIFSFFGGRGCEKADPSGFTRTDVYRDWIRNVTGI